MVGMLVGGAAVGAAVGALAAATAVFGGALAACSAGDELHPASSAAQASSAAEARAACRFISPPFRFLLGHIMARGHADGKQR
jgi:hypothetical protein